MTMVADEYSATQPHSLISSRHEVRREIDAPGGNAGSLIEIPPPARPDSATSLPDAVINKIGLDASWLASRLPTTLFDRGEVEVAPIAEPVR